MSRSEIRQKIRAKAIESHNSPKRKNEKKANALKNAPAFDPALKPAPGESVFRKIYQKFGELAAVKKYAENLDLIVSNFLLAGKKPVQIHLNQNKYTTGSPYAPLKYAPFIKVLNAMIAGGFIDKTPALFDKKEGIRTKTSRISATDKLLKLIDKDAFVRIAIDIALIELRKKTDPPGRPKNKEVRQLPIKPERPPNFRQLSRHEKNNYVTKVMRWKMQVERIEKASEYKKKKKPSKNLEFPLDPFVTSTRKRIEKINDCLADNLFEYTDDNGNRQRIIIALRRIFSEAPTKAKSEKWRYGGRLHAHRGTYQNLSQSMRETITINNKPATELDFSSMHPAILYAWEKKPLPADKDLYGRLLYDLPPELTADERAIVRGYVKKVFLRCLNTNSQLKAQQSVFGILKADWKDAYQSGAATGYDLLKLHTGLKITGLIERIKTEYPEMEDHFFTGIGHRLMNQESNIAMDIVEHFTNQHIPCLPIHDSFITAKKYRDELRETMRSIYQKHMKFDIGIDQKY